MAQTRQPPLAFFIDIDGTIATDPGGRNRAIFLNRMLNFGIPEEQITSLDVFYRIPAVNIYMIAEERDFTKVFNRGQFDDLEGQRNDVPVPGSQAVLKLFAAVGSVSYFTCREEKSRELTQEWLARYHYPNPERLFICENYKEKLFVAYEQTVVREERVVIVDDHATDLLRFFKMISRERMEIALAICNRFRFFHYGRKELPALPESYKRRISIHPLPSWKDPVLPEQLKVS